MSSYQLTILWPSDTSVPTISGHWHRMKHGILATYTLDELHLIAELVLPVLEELRGPRLVEQVAFGIGESVLAEADLTF